MSTILVIDDDEVMRTLAAESLRAGGHQVITAADGDEGVLIALRERPDAVVTDLMMPGRHGYQVIETLRSDSRTAGVKIMVASLKSYSSDLELARRAGADHFLAKPYTPEALLQAVTAMLGGAKLRVKFWGTRGSIATPGPATARYGGNTSCVEVRYGTTIIVLDAGTGIRELGNALLKEFGRRPIEAHLFVGHTHWDHIQGFPFFVPAYVPGNRFFIYSARGAGKPLAKVFRGQMDADYFPVLLSDMQAHLEFVELTGPVTIGPMTIVFDYLNHPGVAIGFRISVGGKSVVYVSDHEPFYRTVEGELGEAEERKVIELARDADLCIREAQYTEEEYPAKRKWGHSTTEDALRSAAASNVRKLVLFHHDPMHDDDFIDQLRENCQARIREAGYAFSCTAAHEGEVIEL